MIKLFEEYNSYYFIISKDEEEKVDEYFPFTEKELSILKSLFNNDFRYYDKRGFYIDEDERDYLKCCMIHTGYLINCETQSRLPISQYIVIKKLPDEWFILINQMDKCTYYKCDQFDGLLKLIKREILK